MESRQDRTALTTALRDFFFASGGEALRQAYARLGAVPGAPAPRVDDWEREEFAFNRLFVGPGALQAPPFASVYLDAEPQVMGPTTLLVRRIYAAAGLASPWGGALPDDHLSLELDAAEAMAASLDATPDEGLARLRAFLVAEHMAAWIPGLVRAVERSGEAAPGVLHAVRRLQDWMEDERAAAGTVAAG
ncbi:TorD/DmsD family molecular chaperone [Desulfocurvus vexinensis]|uniref:TorD/DmsD family molecular chaperone n=1 Tax=Desulfocurvus vexinensis TaxID=399548 RepID=UPI0004B030B4|nr:molecular chaperone TorD family protein [Desulfocurvus vexinensis]